MSKLYDILSYIHQSGRVMAGQARAETIHEDIGDAEQQIRVAMVELIGEMEQRETEDMALKSWTPEDYKAFGRNELRAELMKEIADL